MSSADRSPTRCLCQVLLLIIIIVFSLSTTMTSLFSMSMFDEIKRMNARQLIYQVLNFGMIVSSALMIWKGLMVVTGSESPIVVVLSGSMEPAFYRGDLLLLTNHEVFDTVNHLSMFSGSNSRRRYYRIQDRRTRHTDRTSCH